ncbi:hypothetical protein CDD82_1075 [Ophiocordyceps australis]|uniref:Required for respiratory growth protein 9, mitochondrial n=1 Tax=Ophiocordyceps australis TaxID=1399860 RepID=A0A2C5XCY9_9HYPO|nr:hypothetical protein CDD82_1075 [Ophiocordyceps australis]
MEAAPKRDPKASKKALPTTEADIEETKTSSKRGPKARKKAVSATEADIEEEKTLPKREPKARKKAMSATEADIEETKTLPKREPKVRKKPTSAARSDLNKAEAASKRELKPKKKAASTMEGDSIKAEGSNKKTRRKSKETDAVKAQKPEVLESEKRIMAKSGKTKNEKESRKDDRPEGKATLGTKVQLREDSILKAAKPRTMGLEHRKDAKKDDVPEWKKQKEALRAKFPQGWRPFRRLSPDALAGVRALHAQLPDVYTTEVLANRFMVSPEAIRRILKSKWQPTQEEAEDRRRRWHERGKQVWQVKAALGIKPPRKWRAEGIVRDADYHRRRRSAIEYERELEALEVEEYQSRYQENREGQRRAEDDWVGPWKESGQDLPTEACQEVSGEVEVEGWKRASEEAS